MSENITLDSTDLLFLNLEQSSNLPSSLELSERLLKPLEEIIRDEE